MDISVTAGSVFALLLPTLHVLTDDENDRHLTYFNSFVHTAVVRELLYVLDTSSM